MLKFLILFLLFLLPIVISAQLKAVPYDHVLSDEELIQLIDNKNIELIKIQNTYSAGNKEQALKELCVYFKETFAKSYFFSWKNFESRFTEYNSNYSGRNNYHKNKALEHLELYPPQTNWKLPFKNLKNKEVSAYEYRHLTRQHKAGDISFLYYYTKDTTFLKYIPTQAKSINEAFDNQLVETINDGNGAYEVYRAGNRMFNWLFVHQILLASPEYTWQDQLTMIKTFLHTGAQLYQHNKSYGEGNHQTRGMSALAMLSIIFKDIKGTDLWFQKSISLLEEHLEKEIYPDGFQFERSVHYHIADIKNYLYPYQIAKINNIELGKVWDIKIKKLFNVLPKIALPDKNAPVLQDDTDAPWSEYNEIGDIMALGAVLFNSAEYKYFASKKIASNDYWYLSQQQIESFDKIKPEKPKITSTEFASTGYYIMRNGWNKDDLYMIISAGLSAEKPDHQHGDMLGIQAYAFGNMILPNYQVRYYLPDLEYFKNSWVKNVALVDAITQGQNWTGNKGGSGFGKFKKLPMPKVVTWSKNKAIDIFIGEHSGYDDIGVSYKRQVIFIKDGFWIIQDKFESNKEKRKFQQVWQGHYDEELAMQHYRSVFPNGAGLEILQLGDLPIKYSKGSARGKGNLIFESEDTASFTYTTLLMPFSDFETRLKEPKDLNSIKIQEWYIENSNKIDGNITDAQLKISKNQQVLLLDATYFSNNKTQLKVLNGKADLFIKIETNSWEIINCGFESTSISVENQQKVINPGEKQVFNW